MRLILTLIFCLTALPAAAQMAQPCGDLARADAIVEPWDENTATFANGNVRVVLLDTVEPAASAFYLMILHPPLDELLGRTCTLIGQGDGLGFAGIFFSELRAGYDPATGLTFKVPAIIYLPEQDFQNSTLLSISVNQSTGDVAVSGTLAE